MTDLRAQLAAAGRQAVAAGLVLGSGGNLSAREPGADAIWLTASGTWLDRLTDEDFSLVSLADGSVLAGNPRPSSEAQLHLHSYRARPDANALIHLHPQLTVLLPAMGEQITLVTIDHAYYVRRVAVLPYVRSGTVELAEAAADAVRDGCNCVVLGHHGCSVLADGVDLAYKRVANLEEAARTTYAALALGRPVPACPPEYLRAIEGTP